jgi:hypothetical protein
VRRAGARAGSYQEQRQRADDQETWRPFLAFQASVLEAGAEGKGDDETDDE